LDGVKKYNIKKVKTKDKGIKKNKNAAKHIFFFIFFIMLLFQTRFLHHFLKKKDAVVTKF